MNERPLQEAGFLRSVGGSKRRDDGSAGKVYARCPRHFARPFPMAAVKLVGSPLWIWVMLVCGPFVERVAAQVGSFDPLFSAVANKPVVAVAVQRDGKILVGGDFTI